MTSYLGGKARIAARLVEAMQRAGVPHDARWWEPFMGGANMTGALASVWRDGVASDADDTVAGLWHAAVHTGWEPPDSMTEAQYQEGGALPAVDPRRGFATFCSWGGKAAGGFARDRRGHDYSRAAARSVRSIRGKLINGGWSTPATGNDFFSVSPRSGLHLYCDPPYENTTGYGRAFDYKAFWERCREWAAVGSVVFASERACSVPHDLIWEQERTQGMRMRGRCVRVWERLVRVR